MDELFDGSAFDNVQKHISKATAISGRRYFKRYTYM